MDLRRREQALGESNTIQGEEQAALLHVWARSVNVGNTGRVLEASSISKSASYMYGDA